MKYYKIIFFSILLIQSLSISKPLITPINKDNQVISEPNIFSTNDVLTQSKSQYGKFVPLSGNTEQMEKFFESLKNSKNKMIKIAHYGDSLIQGDVISDYLREKFQERFGGKGAGLMQIVSVDIKMRQTTRHSYSDDWNYAAIITRNPERLPFGISGSVAVPKPNSWVKYESTNYLSSTSSFSIIKFYYSHADNSSSLQYTINSKSKTTVQLKPGSNIQELRIELKEPATSIELKFLTGKPPYCYGVSLESGNGVYLDNFPMPGNTGVSLSDIPKSVIKDFNQLINYNLVILTYGANVNSPNKGIFNLYENKMVSIIDEFKSLFPNASFLFVGVGDKTMKKGNRFITNPDVKILLETQKKIIARTGITFWNLWESMGGENSMDSWVNSAPPLALKDYSHFTHLGGQRVAQLLFDSIIELYQKMNP
ncbi:MAG: hypothetical protein AB1432_10400 [Bacteroidota bacterium]